MPLLILFIFLFSLSNITAQNYLVSTERLSIEDGLSSRFTYSVLKDKQGFMWIGTSFGLNRYDGYSIKSYTVANHDITDKHIKELHQDDQGRIWACNTIWAHPSSVYRRVDILNPSTEEFLSLDSVLAQKSKLQLEKVSALEAGSQQEIYIGTGDGELYKYQNDKIVRVSCVLPVEEIYEITCSNNRIWVKQKSQITEANYQGDIISTRKLRKRSGVVGIDSAGYYWWWEVEKNEVVLKYVDASKNMHTYTHPSIRLLQNPSRGENRRNSIRISPNDNTIWCQTDNYLNALKVDKGLIYSFDKEADFEASTRFKNALLPLPSVYIDNQNLVWVCSVEGIFKVILEPNTFDTFLPNHSTRGMVLLKDSSLLVASYSGLKRTKNKEANLFREEEVLEASMFNQGMSMLEDRQDSSFWIGTGHSVLGHYIPDEKRLDCDTIYPPYLTTLLEEEKEKFKDHALILFALCRYQNDLWIGSSEGLIKYDIKNKEPRLFETYNGFSRLKKAVIYDLYSSIEGLWVASSKGLFLVDSEKGVLGEWSTEKGNLPFNVIYHIYEDSDGVFWLATKGGGLLKLNKNKESCEQFTTREGLSHDVIYGIYEDAYQHLWISSDYGLMRFHKGTHLTNVYLPKDGIAHEEFNRGSHTKSKDGRIYFGGLNGITSFHPNDFRSESKVDFPLQITSCRRSEGQSGALLDYTHEVLKNKEIVLAPSDKFFTLSFALLDYKNSKNNKYAYRVEGYDLDWTFTNTPHVRINGLPAGVYNLIIQGQGFNGKWTERPLKISVKVLLPIYKQWWFIVVIMVLLFLFIAIYTRWKVQRLMLREKELEEQVVERTQQIEEDKKIIETQAEKLLELDNAKSRFFANISHELRTPLTLILGPIEQVGENDYLENIQKVKKVLNTVKTNGLQLKQLIEEILELSKLESNKMDLEVEPIELYSFIQKLCSPFQTQAELLGVKFVLDYNLNIDLYLNIDRKKWEKILNNLLSNALKFSSARDTITIGLSKKEKLLSIVVKDTGQGIHKDDISFVFNRYYQSKNGNMPVQGGTGIGLALVKELTEFLGGSVRVSSSLGEGTLFELLLPIDVVSTPLIEVSSKKTIEHSIIINSKEAVEGVKVLLVEDHEDMRAYIEGILSPYYLVRSLENGKQALDYLQEEKERPDIIISDWMMPVMDGVQFLNNIKSNHHYQKIPFVMLTARASQENKLQALTLGVDDYLVKPFSAKELLVRVQNLILRNQQRKKWIEEGSKEIENPIESIEEKWLQEIKQQVVSNLKNSQFGIASLAVNLHISERQLHRRVKEMTGLTPNKYIRDIKLQIARELLEKKAYTTISEYAYHIGFKNVNYFTKVYLDRFGKLPADYLKL